MGEPVVIGYCSGTQVHAVFHHCMMQLVLHESSSGSTHMLEPGGGAFGSIGSSRIATSRNGIVRTFLASASADWLWMVDTDMAFKPNVLDLLLEAADPSERPVVGGLCFGKSMDGFVYPTMYELRDNNTRLTWMHDYPKDQLVRVDGTGAACLLMHRSALEKVRANNPPPMEWFEDTIWNGADMGEDMTFCMRLREAGIPLYVHTGIRIGHVKTQIVDEDTYLSERNSWFKEDQPCESE